MNKLPLASLVMVLPTLTFGQSVPDLPSDNTLYSTTTINESGLTEQVISLQPSNYNFNGKWLPINTNMEVDAKRFVNETNVIQSSFPMSALEDSKIEIKVDNSLISISSRKQLVTYTDLDGVTSVTSSFNQSPGDVVNNTINYPNVLSGYTDQFVVGKGEVKNNFILNQLPQELTGINEGYFGFQERFVLPTGWSLQPQYYSSSEIIKCAIDILDENSNQILTIPAPIFFDDLGLSNDGQSPIQGGFIINKEADNWILSTVVPVEWLKSPERIYPVILDPSVTLAGVTGGWQSQNNYVNNPGYVFIGVCCGNLEHRAWLKWDVSSIPDAACVTSVELEIYVNGVGAATTELVHAYDMMTTTSTGLFGPYAGINNTVYTDQGNGLYTSFTLSGTGTYGWYDLGANASTDVMQMMNSYDFYQVSLIFDNEPSTNWKRLTAGQCDLRVTYDNPPCTLLPVGMQNFDVNCSDEKPELKWSTYTESNSNHFSIWKSSDGSDYVEVGQVAAKGNSAVEQNYRWIDPNITNDMTYYKLSQTDNDGTTEFFDAKVFAGCDSFSPIVFEGADDFIHVRAKNIERVTVIDNMGRVIATQSRLDDPNEILLNKSIPNSGMYIIQIDYDSGMKETLQYLSTKH